MEDQITPDDLTFEQKVILTASDIISNYRMNRKIDKLKFEKLLFLVTKEHPKKLEYMNGTFDPYAMGAYSEYIDDQLDSLSNLGLIENFKTVTPKGSKFTTEELKRDKTIAMLREDFMELVEVFGTMPNKDLLYIVYNLYPEYSKNSKIKHRAVSESFETFVIPMPEESIGGQKTLEIKSDKGNKIMVIYKNGTIEIRED